MNLPARFIPVPLAVTALALLPLATASASAAQGAARTPAQAPAERVLALWPADGMWYPARVAARRDDEVQVAYDDGDIGVVRPNQVAPLRWEAGSVLQCNWQNRGRYFPGVVESIEGERIRFRYDDGDRETMTVSRCRSLPPLER